MSTILTLEDKKVLRFIGRYLNSFGMDDGTLETDGFDSYDIPDLTTYDVNSWEHFSNNYLASVPSQLYPILKKILKEAGKKMENIDYDVEYEEDINYGRIDVDIDTDAQEISVNYWYSYYTRGDWTGGTLDGNDDEEVTKILDEVAPLAKGLDTLELRYNGSGDSGYIENHFENGKRVPSSVEYFCYKWLENQYGGWEINEGSQGQFFFNLEDKTITLEHQMNCEETRTHTLFEESYAK